jgi:hypothetical protein
MRKAVWCHVTLLVIAAFSFQTAEGDDWYPFSQRYENWQQGNPFMMGALHNCLPVDHLPERMARFKAAGLNTLISHEYHARHFHLAAHQAGLKWATWHPERFASPGWRSGKGATARDVLAAALETPGCAFIQVSDGPKTEKHLDNIAAFSRWLRQQAPNSLQFSNLSITKIDHDLFVDKTQPDVFSFYNYPLATGNADDSSFLPQLKWARDSARKHQLPFWMYVQSWGQEAGSAERPLRNPDEADIRYLLFTFLAHGGNGVLFFLYYGHDAVPMVADIAVDEARAPAKDHRYENTVKTRTWHAVKDVAPEIHTLSRALLNLRTKNPIGYTGDPPARCDRFTGHGSLQSVANNANLREPTLVSFFVDRSGEEYFMVVNLVHGENMRKIEGTRDILLTFDHRVEQVERFNRATGRVETLRTRKGEQQTRSLIIRLEGGTGDLFKWSTGNRWDLRRERGCKRVGTKIGF